MVQVDVFWTYGIGAGFAAAAHRQLAREKASGVEPTLLANPYFTSTILFLGLLFVPSGIFLLWAFPSWETMHVGDRDLPAWLVTLFAMTNLSQGILGFAVARALIQRGRLFAAFAQSVFGYLATYFILIHGWDGSGYQRFFSASPEAVSSWGPERIREWLVSDVALSLSGMGVFILPVLFGLLAAWHRSGRGPGEGKSRTRIVLEYAALYLGTTLAAALAASLIVRGLGWPLGGPVALATLGIFGFGKRGIFRAQCRSLLEVDAP